MKKQYLIIAAALVFLFAYSKSSEASTPAASGAGSLFNGLGDIVPSFGSLGTAESAPAVDTSDMDQTAPVQSVDPSSKPRSGDFRFRTITTISAAIRALAPVPPGENPDPVIYTNDSGG